MRTHNNHSDPKPSHHPQGPKTQPNPSLLFIGVCLGVAGCFIKTKG